MNSIEEDIIFMHTMFITLLRKSLSKPHSLFQIKTCINNLQKALRRKKKMPLKLEKLNIEVILYYE